MSVRRVYNIKNVIFCVLNTYDNLLYYNVEEFSKLLLKYLIVKRIVCDQFLYKNHILITCLMGFKTFYFYICFQKQNAHLAIFYCIHYLYTHYKPQPHIYIYYKTQLLVFLNVREVRIIRLATKVIFCIIVASEVSSTAAVSPASYI